MTLQANEDGLPKKRQKLETDIQAKQAKPEIRPYKLAAGGGLFLLVKAAKESDSKGRPVALKYWRMKYRFGGMEKTLAFGTYPETSLKEAREKRDDARKLLSRGADPGAIKQAKKRADKIALVHSFEAISREWFAAHSSTWAPSHASKIIARLENDIFPWLGSRPIAEINAPELLAVVKRIAARGALETAHRALANCGQVFRYAVAHGIAERDPAGDLRGALPAYKGKNFAAITDPGKAADLLRAIDAFQGTLVVQCALRLSPLVFVRPGELRQAEWAQIDLERGEWRFIASKTQTDHIVPLSRQAVAILEELRPLTGMRPYLFPGARSADRPMSEAAVLAALRRMGYAKEEMSGHGFRAMARTILAEELHIDPQVIEHQLAHKVPDSLGTAYNRTKFLNDRRAMMQTWADYLDKLKAGADVVALHGEAA